MDQQEQNSVRVLHNVKLSSSLDLNDLISLRVLRNVKIQQVYLDKNGDFLLNVWVLSFLTIRSTKEKKTSPSFVSNSEGTKNLSNHWPIRSNQSNHKSFEVNSGSGSSVAAPSFVLRSSKL